MAKPNLTKLVLSKGDNTQGDVSIDYAVIRRAELTLRALNHDLRKQIMEFIEKEGAVIVSSIYKTLSIEQSVASQHLAILRRAGIVQTKREGKFINYTLNKKRIETITQLAEELV